MAMTPEQWQQLAALKAQGVTQQQLEAAAAAKAPALNPGSPAGNPGYSFGAAKYEPQHYDAATGRVSGGGLLSSGGVYWQGDPGGDTPENRAVFETWLKAQNPDMNLRQLSYKGGQEEQAAYDKNVQAALDRINNGFGEGPGQWGERAQPGGQLALGPGDPRATAQATGSAPVDPQKGQQTPDWGLLAQLSPEEQQILKNMNAMSQLSPEEQQGLRDMKAQQQAQAQQLAPMANLSPEEQAQLREMRDYSQPRGLIDMYTRADGSTIGVRKDGTKVRITDTEGNRLDENFFNTNQALIANHKQGGKTTKADLQDWWTEGYKFYRNDPAGWRQWAIENPDMATRWYGLARTNGQNLTMNGSNDVISKKQLEQENYAILNAAGMTDFKKDGKVYTTNYGTIDNVNSEWGGGDFWQTGHWNTPRNGVSGALQNIAESPAALATVAASIAAPYLLPAIAAPLAQYGITEAMAGGILSAGLSAAQGGSPTDILTAGLVSYGLGELTNQIPAILESMGPEGVQALTTATQGTQQVVEGGGGVVLNGGLINTIPYILDQGRTQGDFNGPNGKYDISVLDNPNAPTVPPEGSNANQGTQGKPQGNTGSEAGTKGSGMETRADDVWVVKDGQMVNQRTGATKPATDNMEEGGRYYEDGDAVGNEEKAKGGYVWTDNGWEYDRDGDGKSDEGDGGWTPVWAPTWTPGSGGTGDTGNGTGDTGNGTGDTSDGTNEDTADVPWEDLLQLLIALGIPPMMDQGDEYSSNVTAVPQDMSTNWQPLDLGSVTQKNLDMSGTGGQLVAPMITPASNSGQASFDQWLEDYFARGGTMEGLIPMITGASNEGSGLL